MIRPESFSSKLMVGQIIHNRVQPKSHQFKYKLFLVHLYLDERVQLLKSIKGWSEAAWAVARFKRSDYFNPQQPCLDTAIRDHIQDETGKRPRGRISMLTNLRYFGFCMNPVTFYMCWDRRQEYPEFILAEITNTPWGERFAYSLKTPQLVSKNGCRHFEFPKAFHVSPFMAMNQTYRWSFSLKSSGMRIHMTNTEDMKRMFFSNLNLSALPFTQKNCNKVLSSFLFMTGKVLWGIYVQAFILWLKKIPFYAHPNPKSEWKPIRSKKNNKGANHA